MGSGALWPANVTDASSFLSPMSPFHNDTKVFVPYCTGDLWTGFQVATGPVNAMGLRNALYLVQTVFNAQLKAASRVTVVGSGVGGE